LWPKRRNERSIVLGVRRLARATLAAWTLAAVAAAGYAWAAIYRYEHFGANAYDLGLFDQTVWGYSRFEWLPNTILRIPHELGDHTDFTLILLAPLYWVWSDPRLLLIAQALLLVPVLAQLVRYERERMARTPRDGTLRASDRLALVAAATLGGVTLAIPLQLEKNWITIGWALEGAALLWLVRRIPDRFLFQPVNRHLTRAWEVITTRAGASAALTPRLDRESLHWIAADHYYDTRRLSALGWRPLHPISTTALPATIRSLLARRLLPESSPSVLPGAPA